MEPTPNSFREDLIELVNELRVAVTGVQVLFAFLLLVPFTPRWVETTAPQRVAYAVGFFSSAIATLLMIGPSVYRWARWHAPESQRILPTMRVLALAGTVFLAVAVVASLYLIADVLAGTGFSVTVAAIGAAAFGGLWYGLPWVRRSGGAS